MSDRGFPRSARLLAAAEFRRVFAKPQRVADPFFTVLAIRTADGPARLGLAIAKKQVRRAVQRNRLKRLAREVFRHRRQQLAGVHIVVMARTAATDADNAVLRSSLQRLFDKVSR